MNIITTIFISNIILNRLHLIEDATKVDFTYKDDNEVEW